jgi:hypothetical protein
MASKQQWLDGKGPASQNTHTAKLDTFRAEIQRQRVKTNLENVWRNMRKRGVSASGHWQPRYT